MKPASRFTALRELTLSRIRLFLREPAALFWVYGFPILILFSLGLAFREDPQEKIVIDLVGAGDVSDWQQRLAEEERFDVRVTNGDWQKRLQSGKTDLVVEVTGTQAREVRLWEEPRRTESRLARWAIEATLARAEAVTWHEPQIERLNRTGSRYIDFLLPGMIGMGLMGGGLWGVGFVVVDMRVRKLLKRFLATPMRRSDFMLALMLSRLLFTLVDVVILLLFGYLAFQVECRGSYGELTVAVLLGGTAFAGIGLLVASRAQTVETASGLMNLVMLPMWVFSGVFFSAERFPDIVQPVINLLPLTALNQLLRGIILDGTALVSLWPQALLLTTYTVVSFAIALRVFRWR